MVIATDDMRDPHIPIIDDHAKIIGWRKVGARNGEIVEFGVCDLDSSLDEIIPGDHTIDRIPETNNRLNPFRRHRQYLTRLRAPSSVITRF